MAHSAPGAGSVEIEPQMPDVAPARALKDIYENEYVNTAAILL